MDSRQRPDSDLFRYSSMGVEFIAAVGLCVAAGWWLDRRLGTSPWFMLGGLALGFAAGLYRLIGVVRPPKDGT